MARSPLRTACVLVAAVGLLAGVARASLGQGATPDAAGATVFPPEEIVHGATLGEWNARQWQWTASFPAGVNPGQDASGATCGYGQSGPVFFVPRNFPPCVVAGGVAVFVPIVGAQCSTAEAPPYFGRDEEALRACAAAEVDRYTGLAVGVDGRDLPDIGAYRASSPLFPLPLPENNVLGAPAGTAHAVADGYQAILAPLPVGEHEVVVHAELTDGTVLPDKVLRITVLAPTAGDRAATPDAGTPGATPVAEVRNEDGVGSPFTAQTRAAPDGGLTGPVEPRDFPGAPYRRGLPAAAGRAQRAPMSLPVFPSSDSPSTPPGSAVARGQ